jgi:GWxTD domain-containing protein
MKHNLSPRYPWLLMSLWLFSIAAPVLAAKLDPASEEFYHMARHFMTRNEEKAFTNLSTPELRQEFIDAFWNIRNPDPDSSENEFRTELEARFEFVNKYLREANRPGWDTDRGMVYLLLGPPNMVNVGQTTSTLSASRNNLMPDSLIWPYPELSLDVWFIDRQGFGIFDLDAANTSPRLLEYFKAAKIRFLPNGSKAAEERFLEFKAEIEPARDRLLITIAVKDLRFDIDGGGGYTARIHLAVNLYQPDGTVTTHKDNQRIVLTPEMQKKGQLPIEWMIPLKKGKTQIDLLVLDQLGGRSNRRLLSVKKK